MRVVSGEGNPPGSHRDRQHPLAVVGRLAAWLLAHPTTTFVLLVLVVWAATAIGLIGPLDWWGDGQEVGR